MAKRSTASRARTTDPSKTVQFPDRSQNFAAPVDPGLVDPAKDAYAPGDSDIRSDSMGSEPSEEDIRLRAYQRYLARGGEDGADFDDWVEAERELRQQE